MDDRRLVGIDLGITSAHTVRVLDGGGTTVRRRKAVPTVASLTEVERAALAGAAPGTGLEVVVEPTGPAWLPIAVFFGARGHTVYRVSSAKAHDLRRVRSRHAKAGGIDADTWRGCRCRPGRVAPAAAAGCARGGAGPPRARDRSAHPPGRHPQAAHQGPGRPAAAGQPADRPARQGRPGGAGTLRHAADAGRRSHPPGPPDPGDLPWPAGRRPRRPVAGGRPGRPGVVRRTTRRSPSPTWPPRSKPRCGCAADTARRTSSAPPAQV
jgi:hypothetical protein